jgi:hypothetical protein
MSNEYVRGYDAILADLRRKNIRCPSCGGKEYKLYVEENMLGNTKAYSICCDDCGQVNKAVNGSQLQTIIAIWTKQINTLTLSALRIQFEVMAMTCKFDIKRNEKGEYPSDGRNTWMLWAGYFECAATNGIIVGDDADWSTEAIKI